jgi:hypothetical protein
MIALEVNETTATPTPKDIIMAIIKFISYRYLFDKQ